jgi:hypothetical protein
MRSTLFLALAAVALLMPRFSAAQIAAPVVVSDSDREAVPNDYLRVTFVPAGVAVTTLSRPGSLRAFATATPLYLPPLKLADFPNYSGLINDDKNVLVAMRCRPQNPDTVDAVLATWPNVFAAVQRDVPLSADACTQPVDAPTQMACFAKAFSDTPAAAVPTSLAHTFSYAGTLYDSDHTALAQWLQRNYGIYPAFAGTGYSVKDSYYLSSSQPMTSEQILVKSVSSEYILKNVTLGAAGCRCLSVAPYDGRSNDRLDPEFISQAGGDGVCKAVDRLAVTSNLNGFHVVRAAYNLGFAMDDFGSSTKAGNVIDLFTVNGAGAQSWNFSNNSVSPAGDYSIAVSFGAFCVDVLGGGTTNGTKVDLYPCHGQSNQAWKAVPSGAFYMLQPANAPGMCLDSPDFTTTPGTQLQIWQCNGGSNQLWQIQ